MILDEFLIALGVKADTKAVEKFDDALDDVTKSADQTEGAMTRAYEATDGFVSSIEAAMGIVGFFTGVLGGAWAMFHGTIMELEDLIKEEKLLTEVTKKQLEQQKKYKESVETLGKRFQSLKVELAFGFLPTMQKTITAIDKFLKANKDAIVNGITVFLKWISSAVGAFGNFLRGLDMLIDKTIGWKNTLLLLAGAFLWLKRAAILAFVTSPLGLFFIALTAIVLLVDDFMTYMDGGESLFGEYWGALIKWVNKAKDIWSGFGDGAKSSIKSILVILGMLAARSVIFSTVGSLLLGVAKIIGFMVSPIFNVVKVAMLLGKAFLFVGKAMMMNPIGLIITLVGVLIYFIVDLIKWLNGGESQFSALWQAAADVWNKIVDATSQAIEKMINAVKKFIDDTKAYFGGIYDSIVKPFSDAFEWVSNKWQGLKGLFSGGINANVNMGDRQAAGVGGAKNSRTINQTNTTNANVIVNGAGNPNLVGSVAANQVNKVAQSNIRPVVWG